MKSFLNFFLSIGQALVGGFVFSHLWNWFIVRKFGLPELTFLEAVGVLIVAGFPLIGISIRDLTKELVKKFDYSAESAAIVTTLFTTCFLYPVMFGIAYVWHCIIG